MASLFYSIGLGDAQMDAAKSADFAKKGCDKEDNFSCDSVADALLAKEKPKAIELYRKTCYGGYDQSCRSLGKVYADDGDGKKAARFYQRACDSGDSIGCLEAAKLYSKGMAGLKADPAKAVEDWRVACLDDIVIVDACYAAGLGYEKGTGVDADATRAKALYRRACDKDHAPSCTRLKKL
jgi:TPR repeat protein